MALPRSCRRRLRFLVFAPLACPVASAAEGEADRALRVREAGTAEAWISWGERVALGYGFAPADLLVEREAARLPGDYPTAFFSIEDRAEREAKVAQGRDSRRWMARDFAEWAPSRGITLARSRATPGPGLRGACGRLGALGVLVQLDAFGGFAGDAAEEPSRWRSLLETTGDLGSVFYELDPGARPDGDAWLLARLDEAEAWESETGRDVLIAAPADGPAGSVAAADPRVEILLLPADAPAAHAEARRRHGKPTAAWAPDVPPLRDPAILPDPALRAAALRTLWELFAAGCQLACLPTGGGTDALRGGPLDRLRPDELPGAEAAAQAAPWGRMDGAADRILETPAERTAVLVAPRRPYPGEDARPKSGYVVVGPTSGGPMRLDGLWYLSDVSPFEVRARRLRFDNGKADTTAYGFDRDDLVMDVPEWPYGGVVILRRVLREPFLSHRADPEASVDFRAEGLSQGRVRLSWSANHSPSGRGPGIAWIQRFPDGTWIGRTPDLVFTDHAPPGRQVYLLSWRDPEGEEGIGAPDAVTVTVPDAPPAAPHVVVLGREGGEVALWARGTPEADLVAWDWEIREAEGEVWRPWRTTATFAVRGAVTGDVRVRIRDAAGQSGPFSPAVTVRP